MAVDRVVRLLVLATWTTLAAPWAPGAAQDARWRQAVDRLAQEKVLAEGCASILKTFADQAPMARVQGQRLYARAKADMEGLIALLEVGLAGERSPAALPELSHRLEAVPRQRRTLCRHVDSTVGSMVREQGGRFDAVDLLTEGSGDAVNSLVDAVVQIWRAYRHAGQVARRTIMSELDGTRWRDYADVPPA